MVSEGSEMERWRGGTWEGMRGREGGLNGERVDVSCPLSFRPELYLELQTGSSTPERPDNTASVIQELGRAHKHTHR